MTKTQGLRLASDIGGTFTDTVLMGPDQRVLATAKTPTSAAAPAMGALDGARRVLAEAGVTWDQVAGKIHGTTLATNALIERRGAKVATITTEGFRDILEIGYERRYAQYAINIVRPDLIVTRDLAFTVGGRMDAAGAELAPLDEEAVADLARALTAAEVDAVAICLLHAYANPAHEVLLRKRLSAILPDLVISLSHEVSPEAREFDRLCTTIANAYIQPLMARYLADFRDRFEAEGLRCPILLMTAGGGMTTLDTAMRLPIRLVESGPAGGAILAARVARQTGEDAVLSFDMGGTTAKLCLIDKGRPQTARRFEIARAERFIKGSGMPVRIPVVEMIEIGAGGGSMASVDRLGRVQVGPQSAGAHPGPAAFGKGGKRATVTDGDVALGFIEPGRFAEGRLQIDRAAADAALQSDVGAVLGLEPLVAARAVSDIVDENMANAGRMHAVESGKDLGERVMIAFGGNGPLHATRVARRAQVRRIVIPRDPGVGSAVGFLFAPVSFEIIRSFHTALETVKLGALNALFDDMAAEAESVVQAGALDAKLGHRRVAFMRYLGQGHEIEIPLPPRHLRPDDLQGLKANFEAEYRRQFARPVPGMQIEVLNWGVTVSSPDVAHDVSETVAESRPKFPSETREVHCDLTGEPRTAGLFDRADLRPGDVVKGPALIAEPQTTTLVSADFRAEIDAQGNIWLIHDTYQEGTT